MPTRDFELMPEISVIMPVYNTASYLAQSIESVLNQTYSDFELIIVDDGSTDDSLKIINSYAVKDKRIKVITQENQGLSEARNSGIKIAGGEYIAFIDSDDFYAKNFLGQLIHAQKKASADIVGCNFKKIRSSKDHIKVINRFSYVVYPNALEVLLHKNNFIHFNVWNKLYKREVIGEIRFVPHIYYEDWVFNCCVFERANCFVWIKERLYGYNYSDNSIMRSAFTEKKLTDYVTGIKEVHRYFMKNAPEKWEQVKRTRVSRTVKMLMNGTLRSKDKNLRIKTAHVLQGLKADELITYVGLSLKNKLKLYYFQNLKG